MTLLAQVQPFWPEANGADGVRVALTAALRRREALDGAALQVQQAQIRCDAMSRHLPQPPLPDPEETLPRPVLSREQIDAALPQVRISCGRPAPGWTALPASCGPWTVPRAYRPSGTSAPGG